MSCVVGKPFLGVSTRLKINRAVQPLKMVRGSKLGIEEVEELYHLCRHNEGFLMMWLIEIVRYKYDIFFK